MTSRSIIDSWRSQNTGTRVLRLWLGITWLYGGWQKATDGTFLNKASHNYIGAQLTGLAPNSPLKIILKHMVEHATLAGVGIMLGELAVGLAVLSGVAIQLAIIGGALISFILWLTVTWSVHPYFLGSDTIYLVAWIALFFLVREQSQKRINGKKEPVLPNLKDRRQFVQIVGVGISAVVAAVLGNRFQKPMPVGVVGSAIIALASFPVGSTMQFTAPDGNPAILFRTKSGVFAYSAICTHQGCTVAYSPLEHTINCPCHGAKFDPNNGAKVVAGPAPTPLAKYNVTIQGDSIVTA
jgi:thiosulfate dehydrogenase [quinone] large subunit